MKRSSCMTPGEGRCEGHTLPCKLSAPILEHRRCMDQEPFQQVRA